MISRHEMKELASYVLKDNYFISLYLNVDPRDNPKDEWLLHFKNLSRNAITNLKPDERSIVQKDIDKIENYLKDRPEGLKRGLAIISCISENSWRIYNTALPFNNQLIVKHDPYIKPLAAMIDLHQRHLVVVVGATRARLLLTSIGEIEEITEIFKPKESADAGRDGSTGDMGSLRAQKAKEKTLRLVHKDAVAAAERVMADEGIKRLLLGGTDKARGHFKETLSSPMREKVVGEFSIDRIADNSEILKRSTPVMHEVEFQFERKALDELFDQSRKVVLGLSDVLTALQQGNVHKIYALSNVTAPGMVCTRCEALTPERDRPCPYCDSEMKHIPYMLDLAIQKAIDQGARVDMLDNAPRLEKAGGIGALLRY